jgi:hypothetical protein
MKYLQSKMNGASRDDQEISSTLNLSLFVGGHTSSFAEANLKKNWNYKISENALSRLAKMTFV